MGKGCGSLSDCIVLFVHNDSRGNLQRRGVWPPATAEQMFLLPHHKPKPQECQQERVRSVSQTIMLPFSVIQAQHENERVGRGGGPQWARMSKLRRRHRAASLLS